MTQEALKLALEALEANDQLINGTGTKGGLVYCMDGYYSGCFDVDPINKQTDKAITAIKEALAQPERNFCARCGKRLGGIDSIHTCTPSQRTWVGLTDEDRKQISKEANYHWEMTTGEYAERIGQLTEAKLKEKNT